MPYLPALFSSIPDSLRAPHEYRSGGKFPRAVLRPLLRLPRAGLFSRTRPRCLAGRVGLAGARDRRHARRPNSRGLGRATARDQGPGAGRCRREEVRRSAAGGRACPRVPCLRRGRGKRPFLSDRRAAPEPLLTGQSPTTAACQRERGAHAMAVPATGSSRGRRRSLSPEPNRPTQHG